MSMTRLEPPEWMKGFAIKFIIFLLCAEGALVLITVYLLQNMKTLDLLPPEIQMKFHMIIWGAFAVIPGIYIIASSYLLYITAYSVMEFDQNQIRLKRPFSQWSGPWSSIQKAYLHNKCLNIQPTNTFWKTWSIRLSPDHFPAINGMKNQFRPGVWLTEAQARWYFFRHVAPLIILVGVLMIFFAEYMKERILPNLNKQTTEFFKSHPKQNESR